MEGGEVRADLEKELRGEVEEGKRGRGRGCVCHFWRWVRRGFCSKPN